MNTLEANTRNTKSKGDIRSLRLLGNIPGIIYGGIQENEKVSVIEAIGLAGDMQISGSRQDVLIIRENEDGSKTTAQLDFTKNDLFTSPYYYLKQNDVVVVDPNYAKVQRSASNPNTGIFFSLASLLLSVIVIISR